MKWLKMSIIITRSVAGATNGATSSPPPQAGGGQGGGAQYDRTPHPPPPPPPPTGRPAHPPLPRKRGREQTEVAAPLIPFHRLLSHGQAGLFERRVITVYPCMVRPPETLIVWPVM